MQNNLQKSPGMDEINKKNIFEHFRYHGCPLPAVVQRQLGHPLLHQHGEVRQVNGRVAVLPPDGRISWNSCHCVECRQYGVGIGKTF